ncbi:MAG TPA: ATP synthase subunit I [Gammaproteobacteria bacterium]|nr:ATP synthase subunit I [Gammaproteobacteria bacterium]
MYRIIWIQLVVALVAAGVASTFGPPAMWSALAGGLNSLIPNAYFARKVLDPSVDGPADLMLSKWFRAEVAKVAMIAGLFIAAFVLIENLNVVALFAAFVCVHVCGIIASLALDPYGGDKSKK